MNSFGLSTKISRAYALLVKGASYLSCPVLLIIRLYWGWQFIGTGSGKLMGLQKVTEYFDSLHIPFPAFNAALAGTTELVGGILLMAGLATRLAAIPLIITMVVAYLTAENDSLKVIFSDPDKFTGATPFLFLFACVIVFVFGPGMFSLDWLIGWLSRRKAKAAFATGVNQETPRV